MIHIHAESDASICKYTHIFAQTKFNSFFEEEEEEEDRDENGTVRK